MGIQLNGITGDAIIPGDVGIGGTLTYEDVTNVDSIGVITARDGIRCTGIVTATAFHGDGSALTGTGVGGSTSINTTGIGTFSAVVSDTATSHRNMIINGAMLVAQRQDVTGVTNGYGGCDRFKFLRDGATAVTLRQAGGADSIPGEGFSKSQHIDITSEDSSMGAANYNMLVNNFDGGISVTPTGTGHSGNFWNSVISNSSGETIYYRMLVYQLGASTETIFGL